ncbi:hypothetical protein GJAV_G00046620 [Gymnothorax javanicus]|nr:hypothetical protein GJAV_G00046620 [Gymnothorax javanicus]
MLNSFLHLVYLVTPYEMVSQCKPDWMIYFRQAVDTVAVNRLYLALVLFSLLKDTDLWSVAERFQLPRGFVQSLLSSASAFSSCVLHFTEVSTPALLSPTH